MKRLHGIAPMAALVITAAWAFALMLAGCSNILAEKPESEAQIPAGFGTMRVSFTQGAARTAMPTADLEDFGAIEYLFAKDGGTTAAKTPVAGVFTLESGSYTLTVQAYVGTAAADNLAAEGTSDSFTVTAGQDAGSVTVAMRPIVGEGTGTLSFTLNYPEDAAVKTFTLTPFGGGTAIILTGTPVTAGGTTTLTGAHDEVASGYYILSIKVAKADSANVGVREAAHIYRNLTTAFSYTFADAEFISVPDSVSALTAYLETLPSNTAETPATVPLKLAFNTGTTVPSGQTPWADINTAVVNSGKYVILDLSTSTAAHGTTANTIEGAGSPSDNYFNIIQNNTYIKGVILPDSVTSIGDYTFVYCSGFTSVTIPGSVTSIGDFAFIYCSGLTAFTVAESNTAYSVADGILYNKNKTTLISVPGAISGALNNLPNTLTSIGYGAFGGCSGLTSVTIPGSVTTIGEWAFADCSGLTSVTIPDSVTTIGEWAFVDCSGLTSVTISDSVTTIGDYAFCDCSGLTSVTIPDSVTSIGEGTFSNCSSLTSVTIPGSVTTIGEWAFHSCSGLTSVTIPGSVTSIGDEAFSGCSGLTSVIFGAGSNITTAWSNSAFSSSTSLWNVYSTGSKPGTYTRSGDTWTQQKDGSKPLDGTASATITFWENNDGQLLTLNSNVTISKTSSSPSFTAQVSGQYDSVQWSVNGALLAGNTGAEITISAADYPVGKYRLGVIVTKNNAPYGTEITFTVTN